MIKYSSLFKITVLVLAVGAGGVAVARPGNSRGVQEAQATPRAEGPRTIGPATFPHQSHFEDLAANVFLTFIQVLPLLPPNGMYK